MKKILFASLLFFSCTKNELIEKDSIGLTSLKSIEYITPTTAKILFSVDGTLKSAIGTEIALKGGLIRYVLADNFKQWLSITLNANGEIVEITYDPMFRCMRNMAMQCRREFACKILCVGGSNISCVFGWALGCAFK